MPVKRRAARAGLPRAMALILVVGALGGCAGTRPYAGTPGRNLEVSAVAESDLLMGTMEARVDIYAFDPECQPRYEGTIELGAAPTLSGLPVGRTSYLVFKFVNSSFLTSRSSSLSYDALVTPRPGRRYDIAASYIDNIYDVVVRETGPGTGVSRQIDRRPDHPCIGS